MPSSSIEYKNVRKTVKQWRWLQSSDQNNVVCFDISTFLMWPRNKSPRHEYLPHRSLEIRIGGMREGCFVNPVSKNSTVENYAVTIQDEKQIWFCEFRSSLLIHHLEPGLSRHFSEAVKHKSANKVLHISSQHLYERWLKHYSICLHVGYISQSKTSLFSQDRNYLLKERDSGIIQSESP